MNRIVIVAARRTPIGRFLGGLSKRTAVELAVHVGQAILEPLDPQVRNSIDQVILGNVLAAGSGMNVARQVAVNLRLPLTSVGFTVNMMCASGIKAIMLACDAVRSGCARLVLCGGTESMSQAPYLLPRVRMGLKLGDATLVDSVLRDGLVDAFDQQHMGLSAERLAERFQVTRTAQDAFAWQSQQRYQVAATAGYFERELVPLEELSSDEHPRPETSLPSLAKLSPAFSPEGTVTAGNASGLNDGAALVLVCHETFAREHALEILAVVENYTEIGCEPATMGLGPVWAARKLMDRAECKLDAFDYVELNEAFAAQALACLHELPLDPARVNPDGGSIALGHPIGATGARLVVHLAQQLAAGRARRSLATLCVGGGMGAALSLAAP